MTFFCQILHVGYMRHFNQKISIHFIVCIRIRIRIVASLLHCQRNHFKTCATQFQTFSALKENWLQCWFFSLKIPYTTLWNGLANQPIEHISIGRVGWVLWDYILKVATSAQWNLSDDIIDGLTLSKRKYVFEKLVVHSNRTHTRTLCAATVIGDILVNLS